jgi:hypothetical protein
MSSTRRRESRGKARRARGERRALVSGGVFVVPAREAENVSDMYEIFMDDARRFVVAKEGTVVAEGVTSFFAASPILVEAVSQRAPRRFYTAGGDEYYDVHAWVRIET